MPIHTIDGSQFKEMFLSGAALLENNRAMIDALNVFPVPDGDTGSNMCHTLEGAAKEVAGRNFTSISEITATIARGALKGARGNSGVILSQIFRGLSRGLDGVEEMDTRAFAKALKQAGEVASKAVMKPKEGTILTVIRVVGEDAVRKAEETDDMVVFFQEIMRTGEEILLRTPDMLPVLKQAGVVDSGGKGLMVFLAGCQAALEGRPVESGAGEAAEQGKLPGEFVDDHTKMEEITYAYCTEMIVSHPKPDMKDADVVRLRNRLNRIGDCVLVVSDLEVVKIHVHTNEPGKAMQMIMELGEVDNIKIENMLEQFRERQKAKEEEEARARAAAEAEMKPFGIVAVALGEGLVDILKELGVDQVVDGGQTMNPSIEDLTQAVNAVKAKEVFILPDNSNIILAAQQAAQITEKPVHVIPTKSVPMGVAAAIAFDPEATGEDNEAAMMEAAEAVHTASVTYAVRDTVFDGMEIHEGDVMGLLDNKLHTLGHDVNQVSSQVVGDMVTEDSSIVTVYYGEDVTEEQAEDLRGMLECVCPGCDIDVRSGGQPLYYYFISVE